MDDKQNDPDDVEQHKKAAADEHDDHAPSDFEAIKIDDGSYVVRLTADAMRRKVTDEMEE